MLAYSAVTSRLAACAQVLGPTVSVYWYRGEVGEGEEWRVVLTTTRELYGSLEAHLLERHPRSDPEVLAVEVTAGAAPYLEWISAMTSQDGVGGATR